MQYGYIRNGETLLQGEKIRRETLLAIFSTTQFLFIICLKINLNLVENDGEKFHCNQSRKVH